MESFWRATSAYAIIAFKGRKAVTVDVQGKSCLLSSAQIRKKHTKLKPEEVQDFLKAIFENTKKHLREYASEIKKNDDKAVTVNEQLLQFLKGEKEMENIGMKNEGMENKEMEVTERAVATEEVATEEVAKTKAVKKRKLLFDTTALRAFFFGKDFPQIDVPLLKDKKALVDWCKKTVAEIIQEPIDFGLDKIADEDLRRARDNSKLSFFENCSALLKSDLEAEDFEAFASGDTNEEIVKKVKKYHKQIKMCLMNYYKSSLTLEKYASLSK
jgi:hypothetical protein